jgi:hypothetical protein
MFRPEVIPFEVAEDVAKVIAPVCAVPLVCCRERRPVFVTAPFAYVRPEENVVVAVHVGTPFKYERTNPAVPTVVVERFPEPLPYSKAEDCTLAQPVPPNGTEITEPFQVPDETVPRYAVPATVKAVVEA